MQLNVIATCFKAHTGLYHLTISSTHAAIPEIMVYQMNITFIDTKEISHSLQKKKSIVLGYYYWTYKDAIDLLTFGNVFLLHISNHISNNLSFVL